MVELCNTQSLLGSLKKFYDKLNYEVLKCREHFT